METIQCVTLFKLIQILKFCFKISQ